MYHRKSISSTERFSQKESGKQSTASSVNDVEMDGSSYNNSETEHVVNDNSDNDDEFRAINRLAGNYRKFSESRQFSPHVEKNTTGLSAEDSHTDDELDKMMTSVHGSIRSRLLRSHNNENVFEDDDDGDDDASIRIVDEEQDTQADVDHEEDDEDDDDDDDDAENDDYDEDESAAFQADVRATLASAFNVSLGRNARREIIEHDDDEDDDDDDDEDNDDEDDDNDDEEDDENEDDDESNSDDNGSTSTSRPGNNNETAASAFQNSFGSFGSALGRMLPGTAFGQMFSGGLRVNGLVDGLIKETDPYLLLETLTELSESLLMMNDLMAERGLPSYKLSKALVDILNNPFYQEDLELQLVACRCMYNLAEVNNDSIYDLVNVGAVDALNSKLMEISFIDLAEQALQNLEIITKLCKSEVIDKNYLSTCLMFLDFFTIHTQRKALNIALYSFEYVPVSKFDVVKEVFPIIVRVATEYSDPSCVEISWRAIAKVIESYQKEGELLEELISVDLLKRLGSILPSCLGRGSRNQSNSLMSFGACLKVIQSLATIANVSPDLSILLLKDCQIHLVIDNILHVFEKNDLDRSSISRTSSDIEMLSQSQDTKSETENNLKISAVSIDALMAAPKDLNIAILKLLAALIPYSPDNKGKNIDIGGYLTIKNSEKRNEINKDRLELYKSNNENISSFQKFSKSTFILLLKLYSSSVDYQLRRLVYLILYRIVFVLNKDQLKDVIKDSNISAILASMITHGKHLLIKDASLSSNVLQASNSSVEEKHPFILLYGTVLTTNLLLGKLPEVLLPEFEKEGLIDNITSFLKLLHQDKRVEEYNEDEDLEMVSQIDNSGTGLSSFSRSKIYHAHENSDFDENGNFSDGDENATDNDVDEDDDEDEEDYNEEGNEVERNEVSDAEHSDIEHDHIHPRGVRSGNGCKVLPVIDYSVAGDGAYIVSMEIILKVLIRNCTEIERDYEHFKKTMKFEVSESFQELEKLSKMFSSIDVKTFNDDKDTWMEIWSRFGKIIISDNDKNKSISSFELISSGFIEKLSQLFDSEHAFEGSNCLKLFKYLFCSNSSPLGSNENLPIVVLVSKLEEALTRSESFEIVSSGTSLGGSSNVVASRASSMAKQIKIKLISDDSSIGEQNSQMMVMVHAIATFKSLNGFMKSRIGGLRGLMKALISSANAAASGSGGNIRTNDRDPEDREFYIEFSINNEVIPSETTIYGAIYRSLQTTPNDLISPNQVWLSGPHEVHFKRVWGSAPTVVEEEIYPKDSNYDECMDILGDSTTIDILQLLKVFYKLNSSVENAGASDALFLNYKLTAKLNRQLEEPLIVASGTLPGWSVYITRNFPFLFPLDTRLFFLQTTSFGYSRLIHQWQIRSRRDDEPTNGSGSIGGRGSSSSNALQLGRPVRHKLRVSRRRILQGAMKILETYGSIPGLLEIEYFDEVGTGLGPTLEFYSLVSKEFSRSLLYMWRDDSAADVGNTSGVERNGSNGDAFIVNNELENAGVDEKYVDSPLGLFPRPLSKDSKHYKKNLYMFSTLGKFIARALLDSRIIDFAFNPLFFEICNLCEYKDEGTDDTIAGTAAAENNDGCGIFKNFSRSAKIDYVKLVDPVLAKSLIHLNKYLVEYEEIDKLALKNGFDPSKVASLKKDVKIDDCSIEQLSLVFTLPGYLDVNLCEGGENINITFNNLERYIDSVVDITIGNGVLPQAKSFVEGFSKVFPYSSMIIFNPKELVTLLGSGEEDWSFETLISIIRADHGYTTESPTVRNLLELMSEFNSEERRKFLQFLTGSPRLPVGGFKSLNPELTVVLKHSEDGLKSDDYLPSVMTCANYLKLPDYSSKEVLKRRLKQAFNEGAGSFLLS